MTMNEKNVFIQVISAVWKGKICALFLPGADEIYCY